MERVAFAIALPRIMMVLSKSLGAPGAQAAARQERRAAVESSVAPARELRSRRGKAYSETRRMVCATLPMFPFSPRTESGDTFTWSVFPTLRQGKAERRARAHPAPGLDLAELRSRRRSWHLSRHS